MPVQDTHALDAYGWNATWAAAFAPHAAAGLVPARVVCELRRNFYAVQLAYREALAECSPGFFHDATRPDQWPAVGDWVGLTPRPSERRVDLHAVLPRRTKFSRRAAGDEAIEQIVAANVDTVFLVSGLDRNHNPARLQRFLVAARESGAAPVIVLNKADLAADAAAVQTEIETLLPGVPVHITSVRRRRGLQLLRAYARPGETLAFIGSSGVGKSSLINALTRGEAELPIGEVREKDSKGRHTTTRREIVLTASGALVIDTPGMRELQLWGVEDGVEAAFTDIAALAAACRFGNCLHGAEPGCAVRAAVAAGTLPATRLDSYLKLKVEQRLQRDARKVVPRGAPPDNRVKHRKLNAERDAWKKRWDE